MKKRLVVYQDYTIPSYVGSIANHYKDLYETTCISWKVSEFLFLWLNLKEKADFGEAEPEFYLSKICKIPSPKKYGPNIRDDVFFVLVPRCFYVGLFTST